MAKLSRSKFAQRRAGGHLRRGAIDGAATLADAVGQADLVFLSSLSAHTRPVAVSIRWSSRRAGHGRGQHYCEIVDTWQSAPPPVLGGHPLAPARNPEGGIGRLAALFQGRTWVLTRTSRRRLRNSPRRATSATGWNFIGARFVVLGVRRARSRGVAHFAPAATRRYRMASLLGDVSRHVEVSGSGGTVKCNSPCLPVLTIFGATYWPLLRPYRAAPGRLHAKLGIYEENQLNQQFAGRIPNWRHWQARLAGRCEKIHTVRQVDKLRRPGNRNSTTGGR